VSGSRRIDARAGRNRESGLPPSSRPHHHGSRKLIARPRARPAPSQSVILLPAPRARRCPRSPTFADSMPDARPQCPRFMLDEDVAIPDVPKFPFSITSCRGQSRTIGTPCERIASIRMSSLEKMNHLSFDRIVDRTCPDTGSGGQMFSIRRPATRVIKSLSLTCQLNAMAAI